MSEKKPARRVVVTLSAREQADPVSQLLAIRAALAAKGVSLAVRNVQSEDFKAIAANPIKDEPLETKAREFVMAVLDKEAAKARQQAATANTDAARLIADIAAQRQGFSQYMEFLVGRGIRISLDIYESFAGTLTGAMKLAKTLISGGSKSSDDK